MIIANKSIVFDGEKFSININECDQSDNYYHVTHEYDLINDKGTSIMRGVYNADKDISGLISLANQKGWTIRAYYPRKFEISVRDSDDRYIYITIVYRHSKCKINLVDMVYECFERMKQEVLTPKMQDNYSIKDFEKWDGVVS